MMNYDEEDNGCVLETGNGSDHCSRRGWTSDMNVVVNAFPWLLGMVERHEKRKGNTCKISGKGPIKREVIIRWY